MSTFLLILGIYFLYRFIADFVIPVYRTSKRVHQQFRNMQQGPGSNGNHSYTTTASDNNHPPRHSKASSKDYIDFEEVKD